MISTDAFARSGIGNAGTTTRKEQWFVATKAGIFPMTADAIEQSLERGLLHATTKVWTSGMQAWVSLGSMVGLEPKPDSLRSQPASYPPPLPARHRASAGPKSVGPKSVSPVLASRVTAAPAAAPAGTAGPVTAGSFPAAPARHKPPAALVETVIRRRIETHSAPPVERSIAEPVHASSARALDFSQPSSRSSLRWLTWMRSRETWQCVLFSFVAGTALGLMMYHRLLWGAPTESMSQRAEGHPEPGAELTRHVAAASAVAQGDATEPQRLVPTALPAPVSPPERAEAVPENPARPAASLAPPAAAKHARAAHRKRARQRARH